MKKIYFIKMHEFSKQHPLGQILTLKRENFKVKIHAVLTNRKLLLLCRPELDQWDFLLVNAAWGFNVKFYTAQSSILIGPALADRQSNNFLLVNTASEAAADYKMRS